MSQADFYGGRHEATITADFQVSPARRLYLLTTSTAALEVAMPDATDRRVRPGRACVYVVNDSASTQSFTITDFDGGAITLSDGASTLDPGEIATMFLADDSTAAGTWYGRVDTVGLVANSGPSALFYSFGGTLGDTLVHEFNQATLTWSNKTGTLFDHSLADGFVIGTVGYYFGNDTAPQDKIASYDPDTHTAKTDLTIGNYERGQSGAAAGSGYVLGWLLNYAVTEEYDDGGDAWTSVTSKTTTCFFGRAFDLDDKVYVMNGEISTAVIRSNFEVYDPAGDTWLALASQTGSPVQRQASFVGSNSRGYRAGGQTTTSGNTHTDEVIEYNDGGDVWATRTPMISGRFGSYGAGPEGHGIVACGFNTANRDETFEYDDVTDSWTQHGDAPAVHNNPTQLAIAP